MATVVGNHDAIQHTSDINKYLVASLRPDAVHSWGMRFPRESPKLTGASIRSASTSTYRNH